jgi:hypothetical protein
VIACSYPYYRIIRHQEFKAPTPIDFHQPEEILAQNIGVHGSRTTFAVEMIEHTEHGHALQK